MQRPLILISDAHLGAPQLQDDPFRESELIRFLEYAAGEQARLFIVGDLFEFWFEYREVVPRRNFALLATLFRLVRAGIEIHYLAGNHDLWLGSFLRHEIGLEIHHRETCVQSHGFNVYLTHGDGAAVSDRGYRRLKRVLTNKACIFLYRLIHPDFGIPFAKRMSQVSRGQGEAKNPLEADYRSFACKQFSRGYDIVALGHTHIPKHEVIGGKHYINLGDWISQFSYCRIDENGVALRRWPGHELCVAPHCSRAPESELSLK